MRVQFLFVFSDALKWSPTGDSLTRGQRKRAKLIRTIENKAYDDRSTILDVILNKDERPLRTSSRKEKCLYEGASFCSLRKKF